MTSGFDLFSNSLTGSIPSEFGAWTEMTAALELYSNQLCDNVPSEVAALSTQIMDNAFYWYITNGNSLGTPCW